MLGDDISEEHGTPLAEMCGYYRYEVINGWFHIGSILPPKASIGVNVQVVGKGEENFEGFFMEYHIANMQWSPQSHELISSAHYSRCLAC